VSLLILGVDILAGCFLFWRTLNGDGLFEAFLEGKMNGGGLLEDFLEGKITGVMFSGFIFFWLALGTGIPSSTGQSKVFISPGDPTHNGVRGFCFWSEAAGENGTDDLGILDVKDVRLGDTRVGAGIPSSTGKSKDFFAPGELMYNGVEDFCFWNEAAGEIGIDNLGVLDVKDARLGEARVGAGIPSSTGKSKDFFAPGELINDGVEVLCFWNETVGEIGIDDLGVLDVKDVRLGEARVGAGIPSSTGQSKDFFAPGELIYDGVESFCFWSEATGEIWTDDLGVLDVKDEAENVRLGEADDKKGDEVTTFPIWW